MHQLGRNSFPFAGQRTKSGGDPVKQAGIDDVVNAVLYEGYILYPYRPSSKKNCRERFTFGRVYPKDYSDSQGGVEPWSNQTQCLVQTRGAEASIEVNLRFLHPMWREVGYCPDGREAAFQPLSDLSVAGVLYQSWQEAVERNATVSVPLSQKSQPAKIVSSFSFQPRRTLEALPAEQGIPQAAIQRRQDTVQGVLEVEATPASGDIFKITIRVSNCTPLNDLELGDQDAVLMRTFASTHTILRATDGEFVSLLEPPDELREFASQCKNVGTWPVLVGVPNRGQRDTMLSSPIILYDYPEVAAESSGSFFDGTEIDEILTLRVLTMTDSEKLEMRRVDEQARHILERAESVGSAELMKMHGTMRSMKPVEDFFNPAQPLKSVFAKGRELGAGSRVRIHPKKRADAIDMMLDGKTATIEAIEEDAEGLVHVALVVEDDPGKDLGLARQPGHRFFYSVEEIEPLEEVSA
jgi:hydrogenase maturation protease